MEWTGLGLACRSSQALQDGGQIEASIEQVLDLPEIAMGVLSETEGVVCACQGSLQISKCCVDGQERRMFDAGGTAAGNVLLMHKATATHCGETSQAIGDDGGWSGQGLFGEFFDGRFGAGAARQTKQDCLTRFSGLYGSNEGDLVLRSAPWPAATELTASSISTRPVSCRLSSRWNITSMSLCLMSHAVGYETPMWRLSSSAETLFLACVIKCIAMNHFVKGSLVESKIVPLVRLH